MEIQNKLITAESLMTLHEHNKGTYVNIENPISTGTFSLNRTDESTVGEYSVAIGFNVTASGEHSYAEGSNVIASGKNSHAGGDGTIANGEASYSSGMGTIASGDAQTAMGKYNVEDTSNNYSFLIGNGESDSDRSNAMTVEWDGSTWFAGNFTAAGNIILSPNQYGDTLPAAGNVGRIFFKRLTDV